MSVHGQSEPRIYVNTHHKASAEGLEGLTGLSFTKGRASEPEELMSRRVRMQKKTSLHSLHRILCLSSSPERSCNRFSADVWWFSPVQFGGELLPQHYKDGWPLREGIGRALQLRKLGAKQRPAKSGQDIYLLSHLVLRSFDHLRSLLILVSLKKTPWESLL